MFTYTLCRFNIAYRWFEKCHFTHIRLVPLCDHYPPHYFFVKNKVNTSFNWYFPQRFSLLSRFRARLSLSRFRSSLYLSLSKLASPVVTITATLSLSHMVGHRATRTKAKPEHEKFLSGASLYWNWKIALTLYLSLCILYFIFWE